MEKLLKILVLCLLAACTKEPIIDPCNCGVITGNTNNGVIWSVTVDYCGELETIDYHFNMDNWHIGDTVCKLEEVKIIECKP